MIFKRAHPHFELDTGHSKLVDSAAKAQAEYEQSRMSYNARLVEYENLTREVGKIPDRTLRYAYDDNPWKERILQTEMSLLEARTRYATDNPKVKMLEASLAELRKIVSEDSQEVDLTGQVYERNPLKKT